MPAGIGAAGIAGLAFEVTPGTYVAPTKYFPLRNENLAWKQDTIWRRVIAGVADPLGAVPGNGSFDGDIEIEALHDVVPYFLYASRAGVVKTGATPFIYTATPTAQALVTVGRTLSLTIVRNGVTFGYTNCVVAKQSYSIDNGMLIAKYSIMGSDEASQSLPTATYGSSTPFGAGQYAIEIPTATQVFDADAFTFDVDDSGNQAYRLRNTGRGPAFAWFGDRTTNLSVTRDFLNRTDYDSFKALTSQAITVKAIAGTNEIDFSMPGAITETYEVALGGTGELVRAQTKYMGVKASPAAYQIVVKTTESIT